MRRPAHRSWHRKAVAFTAALPPALILTLAPAAPALADGEAHSAHGAAPATATSAASMDVVHAAYLDLTGNVADLRTRVAAWQGGDEGSLNTAGEKLERIQVALGHVAWPASFMPAIARTQAALPPMQRALASQDPRAAAAAATVFGDASHDVTHAFYGDYLLAHKAGSFTGMAAHAGYLDMTANIADLKTRVTAWQQGDADSLGVAQEKAERIQLLAKHLAANTALAKPVGAIDRSLRAVSAALQGRDVRAAQAALAPLSDASHDLTHDFYAWLNSSAGARDPACVEAAYLDLNGNIADLRARVTAWQQGDASSLGVAQEKVDRIDALLSHVVWPREVAGAVRTTGAALVPLAKALKAQDVPAAQAAAAALGDGAHDVTHAVYGDWLPVAHTAAGPTADAGHADGGHGAGAAAAAPARDVKTWVLGAFAAVNALVIAGAAALRRTYGRTSPAAMPRAAGAAVAVAPVTPVVRRRSRP